MKIRAIIIEGEVDEATIAAIHAAIAPEAVSLVYNPSVADIIGAVAKEMGVPARDIVGPWKGLQVVRARFAVTWLARHASDRSYPQIAAVLNRDHSTIMSQMGRAEALRETDRAFREMTDRLLARYPSGANS